MTNELLYIRSLQNKHRWEIGFLPECALQLAIDEDRVRIQTENNDPCGYLLHAAGIRGRILKIYQVVIQIDARNLCHATRLVLEVERRARLRGCLGVSLRCALDLDANQFWTALGYKPVGTEPAGLAKGRTIMRYEKLFGPELPLTLLII